MLSCFYFFLYVLLLLAFLACLFFVLLIYQAWMTQHVNTQMIFIICVREVMVHYTYFLVIYLLGFPLQLTWSFHLKLLTLTQILSQRWLNREESQGAYCAWSKELTDSLLWSPLQRCNRHSIRRKEEEWEERESRLSCCLLVFESEGYL